MANDVDETRGIAISAVICSRWPSHCLETDPSPNSGSAWLQCRTLPYVCSPSSCCIWAPAWYCARRKPLVVPELLCHLFSPNLSAHARFNMLRSQPGRRNSGVKPERSLSPRIEEILYRQSSTYGADVRAPGKGQKFSLRNRSCGFHDRLWAGAASQSSVIRDRANSCFAARHA